MRTADLSGSILVGGVSQILSPSITNTPRDQLYIHNNSSGSLWLSLTGTNAVISTSSIEVKSSQSYTTPADYSSRKSVSIIGQSAGQSFFCKETFELTPPATLERDVYAGGVKSNLRYGTTTADDTTGTTITANTEVLQDMFNALKPIGGEVKFSQGVYSFRDGTDPLANVLIGDSTVLTLDGGAILQGRISSTDGFSKHLLANEFCTSNFTVINSYTHVQDPVNSWFNTCVFNVGSVANPVIEGGYVYIRPAYSAGDTTNFFNYIYRVQQVDNTDPLNKKFTIQIPLSSDSLIPITGNLICYPANAFIKVNGLGFVEQFQQRRGSGAFNKIVYQQLTLNKVRDCYVDLKQISKFATDSAVGSSQGNVSVCLANAFDCVIDGCEAVGGANGVMVFGTSRGITINRVGGLHKDDLIAIFTDGANTPLFDSNGTQVNSAGEITNVNIDFMGKPSRSASSATVKLNSQNNHLIDGVVIKNGGQIGSGVFFHVESVAGGSGLIGNVSIKDINIQPRSNIPFCTITAFTTGSLVINKIAIDNLNISRGMNGSPGLSDIGGSLVNFTALASCLMQEFSVANSEIMHDTGVAGATMNPLAVPSGCQIDRFYMSNTKWGGSAITRALSGITCVGTGAIRKIEFDNCELGFPFQGAVNVQATSVVVPDISFRNCRSFNSSMNAFVNSNLPSGSKVSMVKCDFSNTLKGGLFMNTATVATYNIFIQDCTSGARQLIDATVGTNHTYNIRSGGGNTSSGGAFVTQTLGGAGNTWNFLGDCHDIRVDITGVARTPGTIIYNTNAAAGTLAAAGLVICDAATVWHLMTDPTKTY